MHGAQSVITPGAPPREIRSARYGRLRATLRVPGDKSISHRAALFNAVAEGEALLTNFSSGADCASTLACLERMGVTWEQREGSVHVHGVGGTGGLREPADVLDCGNSGTTMRLLTGLLAGQGFFAVLSGDGSLRCRPMARVAEPLRRMGARVFGRDGDRLPPLAVAPARLQGAEHRLPIASAQVKSALLLAGLFAEGGTTVVVEPARTRDHTERLLRAMGADVQVDDRRIAIAPLSRPLQAVDVAVPGDFSSAAYWLVLACLHPDAEVRVEHVGLNPTRTGLLSILQAMGADVRVENARDEAGEPIGDLVARSSAPLRGLELGGDLVPLAIDELPLVPLLAMFAEGESVVRDAAELRVKESDRIAAVAEGLTALGGQVDATEDGWRIRPGPPRESGVVEAHHDHRIAMVLALAGTLGAGARLAGADAVAISYPGFWDTLAAVVATS